MFLHLVAGEDVRSYLLNAYGLLGKPDQQDSRQFQQSIYDACFGRSLVVFDQSTHLFSLVYGLKVSCIVCSTEEGSSAMH